MRTVPRNCGTVPAREEQQVYVTANKNQPLGKSMKLFTILDWTCQIPLKEMFFSDNNLREQDCKTS